MMKLGVIDYYLDEWHANEYPGFISKITDKMAITHAYAKIDSPNEDGLTTDQWCEKHKITKVDTIDEIVEICDGLIVLSPDNPEMHVMLSEKPLKSGKPVYIDKTFATNLNEANTMFELSEKYNSPMWSSSALRFSQELKGLDKTDVMFIDSRGAGTFEIYGIHQYEPLVSIFGSEFERIMYIGNDTSPSFVIEFSNKRKAITSHFGWECPFDIAMNYKSGNAKVISELTQYFDNFIVSLVDFFENGTIPVKKEETLAVVSIIECAYEAKTKPYTWIERN